jgi:hypothetical protein
MPTIYELCPIAMFDCRRVAHHPSLALQIPSASEGLQWVLPASVQETCQETPWISVATFRMLEDVGSLEVRIVAAKKSWTTLDHLA